MEPNCLVLGPGSRTFGAIDILDYLILNIRKDVFAVRVSLLANLGAHVHQESVLLDVV